MNTSKFFGPTFSLICFAITGCILLAEAEQEITTRAGKEPLDVRYNGKTWRVRWSDDTLSTNFYSFAEAEEVLEDFRLRTVPGHHTNSNMWVPVDAVNTTNAAMLKLRLTNGATLELVKDGVIFTSPTIPLPRVPPPRKSLEGPPLPPRPSPSPLAAKERAVEDGIQSRAKFTPSHE